MVNPLFPYIAGIIDGEGCISMRTDSNGELLTIRMMDCDALAIIQDQFGGSLTQTSNKSISAPIYQYLIANKKANKLFIKIIPYLILKKKNAKLCIKLRIILDNFKKGLIDLNEKDLSCEVIRQSLKLLNQRNKRFK